MKIISILFIFICVYLNGYSQVKTNDSIAPKKTYWQKNSNPSLDNPITLHFKKFLTQNLIAAADLSKRKKEIVLSFNLNKNNKFHNIRTNSKNKELNNTIINAFNILSVDALNLTELSQLNNYKLQIICKENDQPILKCSSIIVYAFPAIFSGCKNSVKNISTLNACNNRKIQDFVIRNFDNSLAKRSKLSGSFNIYALFIIDKDTHKFTKMKVKAPNDALKHETKKILYTFPKVYHSGYFMEEKADTKYSLPIKIATR